MLRADYRRTLLVGLACGVLLGSFYPTPVTMPVWARLIFTALELLSFGYLIVRYINWLPTDDSPLARWIDTLTAWPMWFVMVCAMAFTSNTHPWHTDPPSLSDWRQHRSTLMRQIDSVFWVMVLCLAKLVVFLVKRAH
mgnify:CR=1 FL=1